MPVPGDPELTAAPEQSAESSFDPTTVPSTFDSPALSNPLDSESQRDAEHGQDSGEKQDPPPLPTFDPKFREPFTGLLFLGALSDSFDWAGHHFKIRTLHSEELSECSLATKRYQGTEGEHKAFQTAVMAASLLDIDGRGVPVPIPIDTNDSMFDVRFAYMMKNWFPAVADEVYRRYIDLEITARQVMEALGGLSG